ncbi:MAG: delta-1-pyrroline-5-carboxylate dehydrogenase [Dehalococcoidia bacterium]|nr:delta-1-pyrroline-5-carboxylate dehydrogenase [Dehalococcoidia bacterium]
MRAPWERSALASFASRGRVNMNAHPQEGVEARTQELGRVLYTRLQAHRPFMSEGPQDWLMALLMGDQALRNRLLRLVDVLAVFPDDLSGSQTASLFREYFGSDLRHLPGWSRLLLATARSPLVPSPLLAWLLRRGTRLVAGRFVVQSGPGSLENSLGRLAKEGRYPTFDLLGEAVLGEEEALRYRAGYLELLERLGRHPLARRRTPGGAPCLEVSLKLSSLSCQFNPADPEGTLRRVRPPLTELCLAAQARGIGVTIDAEQYRYRELAWHIFQETMSPGGPQVTAFARRRGTPFRVRLVKGAYWDQEVIVAEQAGWPVPVYRDKNATDLTFQRILGLLLETSPLTQVAVASHNVRAHAHAEAVREAVGLPEGAVEHQTLYGTLAGLSQALPQMGWVARDYVPVGDLITGMAYLVRRILENTSQAGFLARNRLREDAAELLRAPQPGPEDLSYRRPPHSTGFVNTPAPRLFDAVERERFQRALAETRARWGATYPLHLGSEVLTSSHLVPSCSPSHPDPSHPVGWVHLANLEETERAIAVTNTAAPLWAATSVAERAAIGLRAAEILRARKEEVGAWVVHEGGRTWPEALADVEEAIDHIAWNAHELHRLAHQIEESYRPLGVVACIPPWNFPTALAAGMTSAALMAGNAVILKSAGPTPIVAQALVQLLHEAGIPRDVLIHLPGPGSTVGARLVESPDVDMVAFTGSKEVGTWIHRTASRVALRKGGLKRVIAEMGGKNAIVVFPDADMDEAVSGILVSAFGHAGQKCSACSRVLAHRRVYGQLAHRLVEAARSLPVGPADDPGTIINPVIDSAARARIASYGEMARREGRVLLDALDSDQQGSLNIGPLIVEVEASKARTARVAQEEIFGPILTLTPFDTEEEAVSLANSTVYALTLGVFSRSPGTVARMVQSCRAANIYVNREITGARVGIEPFGGFQLSGTGPKAGSEEYLLAYLTRRSGFRAAGEPLQDSQGPNVGEGFPARVGTWELTPIGTRLQRLTEAARRLKEATPALEDAVSTWKGLSSVEASSLAARTVETVSTVLAASPEVAEPQPTVAIPGQTNSVLWDTPRGIGVVGADDGADPATLAGLVFGALLAGNGLTMAVTPGPARVSQVLAACLHQAGVPRDVLALAPRGVSPETLAAGPIHFAAVDLALERTRALYRVLGATPEEAGQRWLKALISVGEGPRPGEPGFLRRFALPKAVSIRTLRHGADLKLL